MSIKNLGRYSKVYRRMWADGRFRALSPIPPCGQGLWFYLLTNPRLNAIPGLFASSEAEMAESLDWPLKDFRKAFAEVSAKGSFSDSGNGSAEDFEEAVLDRPLVYADWRNRVLWIPNAIGYNVPENPNVIRGWKTYWDEIPDCQLKYEAWHTLKFFLEDFDKEREKDFKKTSKKGSKKFDAKAFGDAFGETCDKPFVKSSVKGSGNQEQEQDKDKVKLKSLTPDQAFSIPERESLRGETTPPPQAELIPPAPATPKRRRPETTLPADFAISDRVTAWAAEKGFGQLDQRLEYFTGYALAKAARYADWDQAFMNSIRDDWAKLNGRPNGSAGHPEPPKPKKRELGIEERMALQGMPMPGRSS